MVPLQQFTVTHLNLCIYNNNNKNQHPTFYRPDALSVAKLTVSKQWRAGDDNDPAKPISTVHSLIAHCSATTSLHKFL